MNDTPYHLANKECPTNKDTCPQSGTDPIHNYLNVTNDLCMNELTSGQGSRMDAIVGQYRPSLGGTTLDFTSDFTIPNGRTWKFYSSTLRFASGTKFTVNGILNAQGTVGSHVNFTSINTTPSPGDWQGITLSGQGASGSVMKYTTVTYAHTGIYIDQSEPLIENCTIKNNSFVGLKAYSSYSTDYSNVDFQGNIIRDNSYHGVFLANSSPTMEENQIYNNNWYGILAFGGSKPVLSENDVSSNNKHGIMCNNSSSPYLY